MADPTSGVTTAASAAGITILGIAVGLRPDLLLAGFWGAIWSMTYADPMPVAKRLVVTCVSTIVSGYSTPAALALGNSLGVMPNSVSSDLAQYPVAIVIGFGAHKIIGPAILKLAARKIDEMTK
jgi:hypothetical protein